MGTENFIFSLKFKPNSASLLQLYRVPVSYINYNVLLKSLMEKYEKKFAPNGSNLIFKSFLTCAFDLYTIIYII